ncbi:MAG TPA: hypothetical protein PLI51_00550 [bacterium]|nr:hypothetical protein [bacterium]
MAATAGRGRWLAVLAVSLLVFLNFYGPAYFSEGFAGMLGHEIKDTFAQLAGYSRALEEGGTVYWDPDYFQYTPRLPQAPIQSPVTWLLLGVRSWFGLSFDRAFLGVLLAVLALLQLGVVWAMYGFLRVVTPGLLPALAGSLAYAFNHQTLAFGIRHGYERVCGFALFPLAAGAFLRFLDAKEKYRRLRLGALTALLLGLGFLTNADVKPGVYFCVFLFFAALFSGRCRFRNLLALAVIALVAVGIFMAQALPTYYAYQAMARGEEDASARLEFSLAPAAFVSTHVSTEFSPRPDYPWENTAEFSMALFPLVLLGLVHLRGFRYRGPVLATLVFAVLWMFGRFTPLGAAIGSVMELTGLRHPVRAGVVLYFIYAVLIARALESVGTSKKDRTAVTLLALIPVVLFCLRTWGPVPFPWRTVAGAAAAWAVLALVAFRGVSRTWLWLVIPVFCFEKTAWWGALEENNPIDPTAYYGFEEIYRPHIREESLIRRPDAAEYRTFFGSRDIAGYFSHNYCLPGVVDARIRPIWPYFCLDEEFIRANDIKAVALEDWSNPIWDLLRVKYFVDLDRYFSDWDEEDTSRRGLDHLVGSEPRLRINPGCEPAEIMLRERAEELPPEAFLARLKEKSLDLAGAAYLEPGFAVSGLEAPPGPPRGRVDVVARTNSSIAAEIETPAPAVAVFSEYWFFPWEARVDGSAAATFPVDRIFVGALVPPGSHRLEFFFNSRRAEFLLPVLFSWGIVAVLLGLIAYAFFRARGPGSGRSPPAR